MVHALHAAWQVLRKSGILIDSRPLHRDTTIAYIIDDEENLIVSYTDAYRNANDCAADDAIDQLVANAKFQLETSITFEYIKFYDTGTELLDYFAARNPPVVQTTATIERIKLADDNPNMQLRVGTDILLNKYRRID